MYACLLVVRNFLVPGGDRGVFWIRRLLGEFLNNIAINEVDLTENSTMKWWV